MFGHLLCVLQITTHTSISQISSQHFTPTFTTSAINLCTALFAKTFTRPNAKLAAKLFHTLLSVAPVVSFIITGIRSYTRYDEPFSAYPIFYLFFSTLHTSVLFYTAATTCRYSLLPSTFPVFLILSADEMFLHDWFMCILKELYGLLSKAISIHNIHTPVHGIMWMVLYSVQTRFIVQIQFSTNIFLRFLQLLFGYLALLYPFQFATCLLSYHQISSRARM